ncbi:MAG: carbohydrate ABC transporter permease [Candidatus Caldatribacteriaceae bacterium]
MAFKRRFQRVVRSLFFWILVGVVLVWAIFPYYWMFSTAFKTPDEYFAFPPIWLPSFPTLENFRVIFSGEAIHVAGIGGIAVDIIPPLVNSLAVAIGSTSIALVVGSLAGFALGRFRFRGRKNIAFWIFTIRMLPPIAVIIPYFIIMKNYRLVDTYTGLIITHLVFNLPIAIWLLMRYFAEIPPEIEDAALVDGCSRMQAFQKILLPLVLPGFIATMLFCMIFSWNEYLFALVLTRDRTETLPILLSTFVAHKGIAWGPLSSSGVIATFPILVIAVIFQKHLIRIMTMGVLKG